MELKAWALCPQPALYMGHSVSGEVAALVPLPHPSSLTHHFMMCFPTSVEPVNPIFLTSGWSRSLWPATEPVVRGGGDGQPAPDVSIPNPELGPAGLCSECPQGQGSSGLP